MCSFGVTMCVVIWMCQLHVHVHVHVRCVKERVSVVCIIYPYLEGVDVKIQLRKEHDVHVPAL